MATSNEDKTKPSSKKGLETNQQTSAPPSNKPAETRRYFTQSGILTLTIIAIIGVAYSVYSNRQLLQLTHLQIQNLRSEMSSLKHQQTEASTELNSALTRLKQSQNALQDHLNILDKNLQSSTQHRLYPFKDWLLLKARYYLELAQINAHWSNSLKTTSALLQQADELLAEMHDQRLFKIRQAIAQEITQIQAIPKIDITGLLSQLDAAQSILIHLPINKSLINGAAKHATSPENKTPSAWRQRLNESVNLLEKLIVIRRHDEDIQPLLSTTQAAMARENIRLNLQEAQWAILQSNESVYQITLKQAIHHIERAFDQNAASTQALIKNLRGLQQTHLTQKKPDLGQSLSLLNQFIESKKIKTTGLTRE